MEKLVEKFCNGSFGRSYCEYVENFISSISFYKYAGNGMTAILYVIIGLVSILIYVLIGWARPKGRLRRTKSIILREIHSGNPLIHRLVTDDYNKARANPAILHNAEGLLKALLEEEHLDLIKIQVCGNGLKQTVAKLEMGAKEDAAVKILGDAVKKARNGNPKKPHEAYEIEMFLVEMLIYKGEKLENVLKCECLHDESLKDARRPLYKAIIHEMHGKIEEAKEYLDEFKQVREPVMAASHSVLYFVPPPDMEFDTFKSHVDRLHNAVQNHRAPQIH
ncbi:hypothetical protein RJT34_14016 [Clitoria ternatea]|uniref:Uncharacterized protein n=1 Tax=Clitoria ternatea TaxID=43366 RepID=A0AAN9JPM0_CLITE